MCEVPDCERPAYARGRCERHYRQVLRSGGVRPDRVPAACAVPACDRRAVTRGWCHGHYLRWHRTGDVRADDPLQPPPRRTCSVDSCGRVVHSHDLCRTHVGRLRTDGEPRPADPVRTPGRGSWITHGYRGVVVPEELRHLVDGAAHALEHRLVMAVLLGRPLAADENVHHRNGQRLDNRPENLELWTRRQPAGQRVEDRLADAYDVLRRYDPQAWQALGRDLDPETGAPYAESPAS